MTRAFDAEDIQKYVRIKTAEVFHGEQATVSSYIEGYRWNSLETKIKKAVAGSGCELENINTYYSLLKKTVFYSVYGSPAALDVFLNRMGKAFIGKNYQVSSIHSTLLNMESWPNG